MGNFYDDTMQGLIEALEIEKGAMTLTPKENMPAPTYVAVSKENELIDEVISIRRQQNLSQNQLAAMTGNRQQAISRFENKEHSPSLKFFYNIINALGYDIKIVKQSN
jgi:DNA-binding XRE family transcriptional regulator